MLKFFKIHLLTAFIFFTISMMCPPFAQILNSDLEIQPIVQSFLLERYSRESSNKDITLGKKETLTQKVIRVYEQYNFNLIWSGQTRVQAALQTLRNAFKEGLVPLTLEIQNIEMTLADPFAGLSEKVVCDIQLTEYILRYIEDLYGYRSDIDNLTPQELKKRQELSVYSESLYRKFFNLIDSPAFLSASFMTLPEIKKNLFSRPRGLDAVEILCQGWEKDPSGQWLINLTIPHPEYQKLKKILALWHNFIEQNVKLIEMFKQEVKESLPLLNTPPLKQQLAFLMNTNLREIENHPLDYSLKKFQEKYKIPVNGKFDSLTLRTFLEETLSKYKQILISMEEWRSIPVNLDAKYVLVNIPNYTLTAYDNGRKSLEMPVIIGSNYRPTPIINSKIDRIIFNPAWYVPHSIAVKDKLPILKKNPRYFTLKKYKIFDLQGRQLDPLSIPWSSINPQSFVYKIVQEAGSENALGKLFFHINTPYGVYLHSTSQPELFNQSQRSLSSGCIRLKNPESLAKFILSSSPEQAEETVKKYLKSDKTFTLPIDPSINIYIVYHTVWIDDQDQVHFEKDVYNLERFFQQIIPFALPLS